MSGKAGHPAYFDPQTEKGYQKQGAVFANNKALLAKGVKKAPRYAIFLPIRPGNLLSPVYRIRRYRRHGVGAARVGAGRADRRRAQGREGRGVLVACTAALGRRDGGTARPEAYFCGLALAIGGTCSSRESSVAGTGQILIWGGEAGRLRRGRVKHQGICMRVSTGLNRTALELEAVMGSVCCVGGEVYRIGS